MPGKLLVDPSAGQFDPRTLPWRDALAAVHSANSLPGTDGIGTRDLPNNLAQHLCRKLKNGTYRPVPLRLGVLHSAAKRRILLISAAEDRVVQTAFARHLAQHLDSTFSPSSFAYRPGRSIMDAILAALNHFERGGNWMIDADIRNFFDSVDHRILLSKIQQTSASHLLPGIRDTLWTLVWDGDRFWRLRRGLAQGSPLSPILSNIYLNDFDHAAQQSGFPLVRYADDFLLFGRSRKDAEAALAFARRHLQSIGLTLHPKKTRLVSVKDDVAFLGAHFHGGQLRLGIQSEKAKPTLEFLARTIRVEALASAHEYRVPVAGDFEPSHWTEPRSASKSTFNSAPDLARKDRPR